MIRHLAVLLIILFLSPVYGASENHAVARVRKGDNIETLLKRYLLTPHICNIEAFADINNLRDKDFIMAGRIYKLPLLIVDFNGKNIRTSTGIKDYDLAKKIEKLNIDLLEKGIRDKTYKENGKLWVPIAEYECETDGTSNSNATIESVKNDNSSKLTSEYSAETALSVKTGTELKRTGVKEIKVPLMGKGYDIVNIEDYSLAGNVYYIISGHGGPDPGAICTECPSRMCEDEYSYDVSLRLARDLMQHGATVHMIVQDEDDGIRDEQFLKCDNDEKLMGESIIPLNQKKRLNDRVVTINRLYKKYKKEGVKIQKAIEIHVDSRSSETRQDVFFYYNKNHKGSKKLAEDTQEVFAAKYDEHQKDRGYKGIVEDRGIYMVRNVLPDMLFVELANIRNASDQKRLIINTNRQALANWLFEGIRK
ncbi:MAG: N-acetylmuramoyl-L-alanine amidase [Saprospiraceae bacterium]|jgi:N-acetylmuramoyl-L-alanine amidase|nr:N-acetylmuramoyl-L-alanine amidase [Saprospiraceae bacterium]MBL0027296.1 N-acetylmuramoyl-L-alanine amidase [Saprospiraceae bacterium]